MSEFLPGQSEWAARLAHDFRIPLQTLLLLQDKIRQAGTAEEREILISLSEKSIRSLLERSNGILQLLSAENAAIAIQPCDVSEIFNAVHESVVPAEGIKVHASFETNQNSEVMAEPLLLRSVFENLYQNAVKAATDAEMKELRLVCALAADGDQMCISWTDNGPGWPPSLLDSDAGTHVPQGLNGWGLELVKSAVMRMNGRLLFRNGENGGAVTEIRLARV